MSNSGVLLKVFNEVTGETLQPDNFESKLVMQKTAYLLSEMGVNIDSYRFAWDVYGPFSQKLQNDLNDIDLNKEKPDNSLSKEAQCGIAFLRETLSSNDTTYTRRQWLEAITSCLYLKKYTHPQYSWEEIIKAMQSKKDYLSDAIANAKAVEVCKSVLNYN